MAQIVCYVKISTNIASKQLSKHFHGFFFFFLPFSGYKSAVSKRYCQFGTTRYLNVAESNNGFMLSAPSCNSPSFTCCQPSSPLNKEKILPYTNNNLDLHRDASVHIEFLKKKQFAIQSKFTCFLIAMTACLDAFCAAGDDPRGSCLTSSVSVQP